MSQKIQPSYLRFRETHHAIARMFAGGWTISKVSRETGYSRRRLNIMLSDPAFQDLIAEKAKSLEEKIEEGADLFHEDYNKLMRRALGYVAEKWDEHEDNGETPPFRELFAILKDGAARFGYSAKHVRVNVNADFAVRLDHAIDRSAKVIEHKPLETLPVAAPPAMVSAPKETPARASGFQKLAPSYLRALGRA